MLGLEAELAQGRAASVSMLPSALRRTWVRSMRLGLAAVGPAAVVGFITELLSQMDADLAFWFGVVGGVVGFVVFLVVLLYAFPLVALCDAGLASALRNSVFAFCQ